MNLDKRYVQRMRNAVSVLHEKLKDPLPVVSTPDWDLVVRSAIEELSTCGAHLDELSLLRLNNLEVDAFLGHLMWTRRIRVSCDENHVHDLDCYTGDPVSLAAARLAQCLLQTRAQIRELAARQGT